MKRIGVLTSGGEGSGMNACIRSVVRTAVYHGIEVIGFMRGYIGLINDDSIVLDRQSVSGIINLGGTMLKTGRSKQMRTKEGRQKVAEVLKKHEIDGLVVIGGDGSFRAGHLLCEECGVKVVGIPATIDNDINGTDFSLGADTAVNVALDALDKIRDTSMSMERIFVVEVMGREYGWIAMHTALAGGCEDVIFPERNHDIGVMCEEMMQGHEKGKISWIIVVAEGKAKAVDVAADITSRTGLETRVVVLGHIQRGGRPTSADRILGARMGNYAVDLLREGKSDVAVGIENLKLSTISLEEATLPRPLDEDVSYNLIKILT